MDNSNNNPIIGDSVLQQQQDNITTHVSTTTIDNSTELPCKVDIPTTIELLTGVPYWYFALLAIYLACTIISLVIFIDEMRFIVNNFVRRSGRFKKTICILAYFPVFTSASFLAVLVPRSGTLCDLVANTFFAVCLYQFVGLMENYLGGKDKMFAIFETTRETVLSTPPLCCCCLCFRKPILTEALYLRLTQMVTQVTIIRPTLMFIAAVLWTNGSYVPGNLSLWNAFIYIAVLNLISTLTAMWSLQILKRIFTPELEERFGISGKIGIVQFSLITSSILNIISGIFATAGIITCTEHFTSTARASAIYHGTINILMFIYGLIARKLFLRASDSDRIICDASGLAAETDTKNPLFPDDRVNINSPSSDNLIHSNV